jgi:hypothetical protein
MKRTIVNLTQMILMLAFMSCMKEDHQVRLTNNFSRTINNVHIGTASLGSVGPGQTSGYQPIQTGNFSISGQTDNGQNLSGSGTISGKGKHKWTVTLSASGSVSMAEDKK